ncbi:MAG: hypothetical protein M5U19_07960 [Microthrixaceae bacterium]|nr:hypothetical protein [Microthrixaceae bacterium]
MRIGAFVDAGDALFDAAVGRASLGRDVVEGILVALTNLEPIVLGDGRATLEEITGEAVPDIRDMLRDPNGVPVPDLRVLISGLAPRITILMGHLRTFVPYCDLRRQHRYDAACASRATPALSIDRLHVLGGTRTVFDRHLDVPSASAQPWGSGSGAPG